MAEPAYLNLESLRRVLERMINEEKDRPKGRGAEKRQHERHLYMIEVHVKYVKRFERVVDSPDKFVTITKDLSRSGLSFIHEHQMFAGEIICVELTAQGAKKSLLVKIIRCRRAGLRVFDVAGEFISPDESGGAAEAAPANDKSRN